MQSLLLIIAVFWSTAVLSQEISGIGVLLRREGTDLNVEELIPGSPAALSKAIHRGDRILAIAQAEGAAVQVKDLRGALLQEAARLLRGPKGSLVRVTIIPAGKSESEARVVRLVRDALKGLDTGVRQGSFPWTFWLLDVGLLLSHAF